MLAVKINIRNVFEYIPEQYKTLEFWNFAVHNNKNALRYIPNEYITY